MSHSPHPQFGKRAQQREAPQQVFAGKKKKERMNICCHYLSLYNSTEPLSLLRIPWGKPVL